MDWPIILKISHIVGTVLGVGAVTFIDFFYVKAVKDGKIEPSEMEPIRLLTPFLRLGLVILILSGFGYFLLYRLTGHPERILDPRFLAKMTVVFVIVANGLLMETKKISLKLGGPISSVSWYSALVLGAWRGLSLPYFGIIGAYALIILGAFVFIQLMEKVFKIRI